VLVAPPPAPEADRPLYKEPWFWVALGVIATTATVIGFASVGSSSSKAPSTTFGDMRAY